MPDHNTAGARTRLDTRLTLLPTLLFSAEEYVLITSAAKLASCHSSAIGVEKSHEQKICETDRKFEFKNNWKRDSRMDIFTRVIAFETFILCTCCGYMEASIRDTLKTDIT